MRVSRSKVREISPKSACQPTLSALNLDTRKQHFLVPCDEFEIFCFVVFFYFHFLEKLGVPAEYEELGFNTEL